jgi:hypothetical protein
MAKSKYERQMEELLRKVSDEDEKTFELDHEHLPFLFRALFSLSDKWRGFCLQLGVTDLDQIEKKGTWPDDCLVLALQSWLKEGTASWRQLITAIYQSAGGGHPALAKKVANSFKELCRFKPSKYAQATSTDDVYDGTNVSGAVGELQRVMGNKVAARWYQMGTTLGAPVEDLEAIRLDKLPASECERKMLEVGGHPALAKKVANSFKELCRFKPSKYAQATSTDDVYDGTNVSGAVGELQRVMGNKVAARWYQMGTTLGAPVEDLEAIRLDKLPASECERKMLEAWLLRGGPYKTWQWLVDSIEHEAGGKYPKLARKISEQHPPGDSNDTLDELQAAATASSDVVKIPSGVPDSEKIPRSNRPNLPELLRFPTHAGHLNLTVQVGDKYKVFGVLLLKDKLGSIMAGLEATHNCRVQPITHDVFTNWLGAENSPVTWEHFLDTLRDAGLERLATLVESGLTP